MREDGDYCAKYLSKKAPKLFHVRKWRAIGGFQPVKCKDVEIESEFHEAMAELVQKFGKLTYLDTLLVSRALKVYGKQWRAALPARLCEGGRSEYTSAEQTVPNSLNYYLRPISIEDMPNWQGPPRSAKPLSVNERVELSQQKAIDAHRRDIADFYKTWKAMGTRPIPTREEGIASHAKWVKEYCGE